MNGAGKMHYSGHGSRGLSLIELMIAMVLGIILTGAAIALFATNRLTYTTAESMARLQEATRTSFELVSRDLREAGGTVCDSNLVITNGLNSPTSNWWKNWNAGLRGYDALTAFPAETTPFASVPTGTATGNRLAGTEAIEVKYGEIPYKDNTAPTNVAVTTALTDANLNSALSVSSVSALTANDLLIACDYTGATIFQATSLTGTTPGTILHAAGAGTGNSPGNATAFLLLGPHGNGKDGMPLPGIAVNGSISKLRASRWYVGCNGRFPCTQPGGTSLFQTSLRNTAGTLTAPNEEIAQGVSNLVVQYLTDNATAYVAASAVTDWTAVNAIKLRLTFTGADRVGTDGNPIARTVDHVITLRNHLP